MVKSKYDHYMLKEIYDEPKAVELTARSGEKELLKIARALRYRNPKRICLTGCGSSYYACMAGKYAFEEFTKIPSSAVPALEFVYYASSAIDAESLVFCLSQSGETIETLRALRRAKANGAYAIGLTNDEKSSLAKKAHVAILTSAGAEIGPGTKTVVTQMMLIYEFALIMADVMGSYAPSELNRMISALRVEIPKTLARAIKSKDGSLRALAGKYKEMEDVYIVGSGPCFPCALQASNLIKEATSIHAEAFSVEEFRHGPMEILDRDSVFIAINPPGVGRASLLRLIGRVKKIGTSVISLASEGDADTGKMSDEVISMPGNIDEWRASFLYLPILQLFAYHLAVERDINPDHFRNIRKTWTIE